MFKHMVVAVVVAMVVVGAACGGKQKNDTMNVDETNEHANNVPDSSANMIAPEKMDEVTQALKRKQMIVSRCLATAMENKEVPRGTRGKVTFENRMARSMSQGRP